MIIWPYGGSSPDYVFVSSFVSTNVTCAYVYVHVCSVSWRASCYPTGGCWPRGRCTSRMRLVMGDCNSIPVINLHCVRRIELFIAFSLMSRRLIWVNSNQSLVSITLNLVSEVRKNVQATATYTHFLKIVPWAAKFTADNQFSGLESYTIGSARSHEHSYARTVDGLE